MPIVAGADRPSPCHYGPWTAALHKLKNIDNEWPELGKAHWRPSNPYLPYDADSLMQFSTEVSRPDWPDQHTHLADFALRFLEADVMLFRSGYTKRHLLRRLRQAQLSDPQIARATALIRRAVTNGTGLEEYREFCRLSARLLTSDLREWLMATAEGAFITLNDFEGTDFLELETFDDATQRKLTRFGFRPKYAVKSDFSLPIVKAGHLTADNKIKRNAWRMLRHIERAEASRPKASRSPT